ncbi:MAG: ROK family protein [Bacteroidales bacterium]|jgi:glucokinase|nr:ROK family protein [Bacteroidales bacterium]
MKKYSIGIDIGGTNTIMGLVNNEGEILKTLSIKTNSFVIKDEYLNCVTENIISLIEYCDNKDEISAIGIGAPNGNYYRGTIEYAPNLNFKGIIPIKDYIKTILKRRGYNLDVIITNDANAAAIGEMLFGGAKGVKDFLMITLGTGLGSGVVVDGKLVYGASGFAGEVGHCIVQIEGRKCNCGRRGCAETYASATGITNTALELIKETTTPSSLRNINRKEIDSEKIYLSALKNDALALKCFDITAKMLAIALANASMITSPEKIFLFGGLSLSKDVLLKPLNKYFNEYIFSVFKDTIQIEISQLNDKNAAILGSAALAF